MDYFGSSSTCKNIGMYRNVVSDTKTEDSIELAEDAVAAENMEADEEMACKVHLDPNLEVPNKSDEFISGVAKLPSSYKSKDRSNNSLRSEKNQNNNIPNKSKFSITQRESYDKEGALNTAITQNIFKMRTKMVLMEIETAAKLKIEFDNRVQISPNLEEWANNNDQFDDSKSTFEHIKNEIEKWIAMAQNQYYLGNFQLAEQILIHAEDTCAHIAIKKLDEGTDMSFKRADAGNIVVSETPTHVPNYQATLTVKGSKEDINRCMDIAKAAFAAGNFDKSKRFLLKLERMCPSEVAKEMLKQVNNAIASRNASEDTSHSDSCENVYKVAPSYSQNTELKNEDQYDTTENLIKLAKDAYRSGDLEKTERFLEKIQRMNPSLDMTDYLKKIQNARALTSSSQGIEEDETNHSTDNNPIPNSENSNQSKGSADTSKEANETEAEKCIKLAQEAFSNKDFEKANRFLRKAERMNPSIHGGTLLEEFRARNGSRDKPEETYKNVIQSVNAYEKNSTENPIKYTKENTDQANNCVVIARQAFAIGNIEKAKRFLLKSERICPNNSAKKLLEIIKIQDAMKPSTSSQTVSENTRVSNKDLKRTPSHSTKNLEGTIGKAQDAEKYIDEALNAICSKNYDTAEALLVRANALYPTEHAKELITNVSAIIIHTRNKAGTSTNNQNYASTKLNLQTTDKKVKAESLIETAINVIDDGDSDNAELLLLRARELYPGEHVEMLLREVRKAKVESNLPKRTNQGCATHNVKPTNGKHNAPDNLHRIKEKKLKAKKYLALAENAYFSCNLNKAEKYALKSIRTYHLLEADTLLEDIREERMYLNESLCSIL